MTDAVVKKRPALTKTKGTRYTAVIEESSCGCPGGGKGTKPRIDEGEMFIAVRPGRRRRDGVDPLWELYTGIFSATRLIGPGIKRGRGSKDGHCWRGHRSLRGVQIRSRVGN